MDEEKKSGYVAGGIFLLIGILISVVGIDSGWTSGKITIIMGFILTLLGFGGIWKPDTVGSLLDYYLKKVEENQKSESISQSQKNTKNSTQAIAKDYSNVNIENNYYSNDLPEEKTSDEKKELIKEIKQDLTKEKLSNTLIKCIRLANIINSEKNVFWLEYEAQGFNERNQAKIKELGIPDYRVINTEIRITSTADIGYSSINYKFTIFIFFQSFSVWHPFLSSIPGKQESSSCFSVCSCLIYQAFFSIYSLFLSVSLFLF